MVALGIGYGIYEFNRTGKDTSKKAADFSLTAENLCAAFEADEMQANAQYLDKVIEVEGTLMNQENGDHLILTLKGTDLVNLRAELAVDQSPQLNSGDLVKLKGICTGSLLDVVLTECVIID